MTSRPRKPSSLRYYQDGPPARVDLSAWRLELTGPGLVPTQLTYDELTTLPRVEENRRYVCVCNWSTREHWGGFLLHDVLSLAGWSGSGSGWYLKQTSMGTPEKGTYESTMPLLDALQTRTMLIDAIGGEPLSLERGYPVRLLNFALYAYKSVKGLRRLEVTDRFDLGKWESAAGYPLDGQISAKRYRLCDVGKHHFVSGPGEVTGI